MRFSWLKGAIFFIYKFWNSVAGILWAATIIWTSVLKKRQIGLDVDLEFMYIT